MRTRWQGLYSEPFATTNGIRQGGIISPILFCVYIDELLMKLESKGIGCWVGNHFYGAFGYADDLTLLSPTVAGLKDMLDVCEKFSTDFSVKYNPQKTVCMLFSRKRVTTPVIKLCNEELKWVSAVKHLGSHLDCNMSEHTEIRMKKSDMVQRVNYVLCTIGECNDNVIKGIFNSKCAHFYGCQTWNLMDKHVIEFKTMWNRCIRRLLNLPACTRTRFLPILMDSLGALEQIQLRFVKLIHTMIVSENVKVKYLCKASIPRANSLIGANLRFVSKNLDCDILRVLSLSATAIKQRFLANRSETDILCTNQILELKNCILPGFSKDEVFYMFQHLCTL